MFEVLNNYLFQHKNISIPGLGTIYLERTASMMDIDQNHMLPPAYHFRFDKYADVPDRDFFSYLASEHNMQDYEAIKWYNEFSNVLRNKIRLEEPVEWDDVGKLKMDNAGDIIFEPQVINPAFFKPVPANGIEKKEPANVQSEAGVPYVDPWANDVKNESSGKAWWIITLIVTAIALIVLLFHFSSLHGKGSAVGNQQKLETVK